MTLKSSSSGQLYTLPVSAGKWKASEHPSYWHMIIWQRDPVAPTCLVGRIMSPTLKPVLPVAALHPARLVQFCG